MTKPPSSGFPPYPVSLAGSLLAVREAVMAPLRPHLRAANVTEQQWRVLRVLADAEFLDAKGVADQGLLYSPTVTRILKELNERQLIERVADPDDGRRWIISITDRGRDLVVNTAAKTRPLLEAYGKAFGEERLEAFKAEARALTRALEKFQPGD